MANNDTDLTIGVRLDSSALPADAKKAEGAIKSSMTGATASVSTLTAALQAANGVMGVLSKGVAILGLYNQVVTSLKMLAEWWQTATERATDAGKAFTKAWEAQEEADRNRKARTAELDYLNALAEANERVLAGQRARAAFAAEMRGMDARAKGNYDAAAKAELDGRLARGELSTVEHIKGTRAIEDAATTRRQQDELARVQGALTEATTRQHQAAEESAAASQKLNELLALGMRLGLANAGGTDTDQLKRAGAVWTTADKALDKIDGLFGTADERTTATLRQSRANAEDFVRQAARLLRVGEHDQNGGAIPIPELARLVQEEWLNRRKSHAEAANSAQAALDPAGQAVQDARQRVAAQQTIHASELAARDAKRAEEDKTLAMSLSKAAVTAADAARAARDELERQQAKAAAEAERNYWTQQGATLRGRYSSGLAQELERAQPGQEQAMAALSRLLQRAESEPNAAGYLTRILRGEETKMSGDDHTRYGQDLLTVKQGNLNAGQLERLLLLLQQREEARSAESRAAAATGQLQHLSEADATRRAQAQQAEVAARQQAAASASRQAAEAASLLPQDTGVRAMEASAQQLARLREDASRSNAELATAADNIVGIFTTILATEQSNANVMTDLSTRIGNLERQARQSRK